MGFLWLFHKSLKKATEFNTSLHVLMPSGFDETIECKPQKTKVMKQGTMNILFFVLKTKLLKNGEAPVLMRITINGSYDDARIQRSVPLNLWNAAKGCSKGRDRASIALNTYIAELHARALEKHKELVADIFMVSGDDHRAVFRNIFTPDNRRREMHFKRRLYNRCYHSESSIFIFCHAQAPL